MAINLLDMVKEVASDALIGKASSFLGESEGITKSAMGAALPSLLGALLQKGDTEQGASGVLDFLNKNQFDGGLLNSIGGLLGGGGNGMDSLLGSGASVLKFLTGDKLGGIVDIISKVSGMKIGSSNTLLKIAGPLIMSVVGKHIKTAGLNALGLKNLFSGNKDIVQKAMPAGLGDLLGFSQLASQAKETVTRAATTTAATANQAKSSSMNLWPWILGALVILGAIYFMRKGCSGTSMKETMENVGESVSDAAQGAKDMATDAANAIGDALRSISLPGGANLDVKPGSFMDRLVTYIQGTDAMPDHAFVFDNLQFETGSDVIQEASKAQLNDLIAVMKAYPAVNIRLEGHTDNTGDPAANQTLSASRAKSVKAYLVTNGIAGARIETAGFGQERPIADNATEAGKEQNRRVELYVTTK